MGVSVEEAASVAAVHAEELPDQAPRALAETAPEVLRRP